MSLDPAEYDISELRRLAGVGGTGSGDDSPEGLPDGGSSDRFGSDRTGGPFGPRGDRGPGFPGPRGPSGVADPENLGDGIVSYQTGATEAMLTRPYLPRLPDSYNGIATVFEWLQYLLAESGTHRTEQALKYYESIEWIGEEARESLETYVEGIADPKPETRRDLTMDDHRRSLLYVARLTAEAYE